MKVKFYLARPKSKTDTAIFARISYSGKQVKYYTPESILPKHWSKTTHRAKEVAAFKEHPEFNTRLDEFVATVKNAYRRFVNDNKTEPTEQEITAMLDAVYHPLPQEQVIERPRIGFVDYFREMLRRSKTGERTVSTGKKKGQPITKGTIKTYGTSLPVFEAYEARLGKKIHFEDITMAFYTDFVSYMTLERKWSANYIGGHINRLITALRESHEQGLHSNDVYKNKGFAVISEDVDGIYLTPEDLQEFRSLDLGGNVRLERTRDWLLIGCHVGLRFNDLVRLTPDMINRDGLIQIETTKTGETVYIPVRPIIREVMAKYGGNFPGKISIDRFNDGLYDLGKLAKCMQVPYSNSRTQGGSKVQKKGPKYEFLTSHTCRRSFASNEYFAGDIPVHIIMAITGHVTEKIFYKYIKVKPNDKAKLAGEIWQKREKKQKEVA